MRVEFIHKCPPNADCRFKQGAIDLDFVVPEEERTVLGEWGRVCAKTFCFIQSDGFENFRACLNVLASVLESRNCCI